MGNLPGQWETWHVCLSGLRRGVSVGVDVGLAHPRFKDGSRQHDRRNNRRLGNVLRYVNSK